LQYVHPPYLWFCLYMLRRVGAECDGHANHTARGHLLWLLCLYRHLHRMYHRLLHENCLRVLRWHVRSVWSCDIGGMTAQL
jgi:hypothetical protein